MHIDNSLHKPHFYIWTVVIWKATLVAEICDNSKSFRFSNQTLMENVYMFAYVKYPALWRHSMAYNAENALIVESGRYSFVTECSGDLFSCRRKRVFKPVTWPSRLRFVFFDILHFDDVFQRRRLSIASCLPSSALHRLVPSLAGYGFSFLSPFEWPLNPEGRNRIVSSLFHCYISFVWKQSKWHFSRVKHLPTFSSCSSSNNGKEKGHCYERLIHMTLLVI